MRNGKEKEVSSSQVRQLERVSPVSEICMGSAYKGGIDIGVSCVFETKKAYLLTSSCSVVNAFMDLY